jgi:CheY-like chemotaxis protein
MMKSTHTASSFFAKKPENEHIHFNKLSALIIDDLGAMRQSISLQLQTMGISAVSMAGDVENALRFLDAKKYDLIICDYNLNRKSTGQHFLEFLRQEGKLSATTVFVMMTAEAEYGFVANVVEFLPDDYILKPANAKQLRYRLTRLLDRRTVMMEILLSLDQKDYAKVIVECDKLLIADPECRWKFDVLKLKSEAYQALNEIDAAIAVYLDALALREDAMWVMIGLARTHLASGNVNEAEKLARMAISKNPNYVAAYDLLAKILFDAGNQEGATATQALSVGILPTAKRYRAIAESAFLSGNLVESKVAMNTAIKLSAGSIVENADDYLSLAQTQVDMGDHAGAILTLEKTASRYGEKGVFGITKNAILSQAYFDSGDDKKAKKLRDKSIALLGDKADSLAMNAIGKAALKAGDKEYGMRIMTLAAQASGADEKRIALHITKALTDTGHQDKAADVIDGGRKRIMGLIEESVRLMRNARFDEAYEHIKLAFEINKENIDVLFAAAQLHLLWLKNKGVNEAIAKRAKQYLSTLDRILPGNTKIMNFFKFYNDLVKE